MSGGWSKLTRLRSAEELRQRFAQLDRGDSEIAPGVDDSLEIDAQSTLARGFEVEGTRLLNRFAILPMEGWDATPDGLPTDLVERRWRHFGASGAGLIWGGEAVAVRRDGRANSRQLVMTERSVASLSRLRQSLLSAHREHHSGSVPWVGLQLTHSGRFARPEGQPAPRVAYRHPLLDARVGVTSDAAVLSDGELDELVEAYVAAAKLARQAGFDFVDIKACHGYLGHELLSAYSRPGKYGGDFAGRTRFLLSALERVREQCPGLMLGVRLSAFDFLPFRTSEASPPSRTSGRGRGAPEPWPGPEAPPCFGGDGSGLGIDLAEPSRLLAELSRVGVRLVCVSAGSPYYNPHIQRPAFYPPSDGYQPPEDPLQGVLRQIRCTAALRREHPGLCFVGSGYSYLQEWLPLVAQNAVRRGLVDVVGLGRLALSYPSFPSDVLAGRALDKKLVCRTFSDCTTAPRHGMVSGCYPLDANYKRRPEHARLLELKRAARA